MSTLTQCKENKQQNKLEADALINDSLETEPTFFKLYDKPARGGITYCSHNCRDR